MATDVFRALILLMALALPAAADTSAGGPHAQASLVVGASDDGPAQAALRLTLAPGWHTYWREPGDAGVPPTFSFDKSKNLADHEVLYPVPTRMAEEGATIFGYRDEVAFPLRLTAQDPRSPIELVVHLAYAVCDRICVPAEADLHATVAPGHAAPEAAAALQSALRRVPAALPVGAGEELFAWTPTPGPQPKWLLTWRGTGPAPSDLFVEAPPGWFVESRAGTQAGTFELQAAEHPAGARAVDLRLTVASPKGAITWAQRLDISAGGG